MPRQTRRPGPLARTILATGLGAIVGAGIVGPTGPALAADGSVTSFDGTSIAFHWFPAAGLTPGQTAPTVLQGPGFGGRGQTNPDATTGGVVPGVGDLRQAGYNVLTWNPRGISPSGGQAELNNPQFEGRDVSALITWVADQPEALLDAPGDPRLGMTGGSYGGGIQLSTAAIDQRVDAIVPDIAWHSLETSLYKGRTIKTGWVNALVTLASLPGNTFDPAILAGRDQARAGITFSPDVIAVARPAGPADVVPDITAPTLILQGTIDNLFTLQEAVDNYRALRAAGVPTRMLFYCGGHGVCLDEGDDGVARARQATFDWLARYLKLDAAAPLPPGFAWVNQRGRSFEADAYPDRPDGRLTATGSGRLRLSPYGGSGPYSRSLPGSLGAAAVLIAETIPTKALNAVNVRVTARRAVEVLGAPRLTLTYRGQASRDKVRLLAQLVDDRTGRVIGHQITPVPVRLDGRTRTTTVPLEIVAAGLRRGDHVTLQVVAQSSAYDVHPPRGSVRLSTVRVALPTVSTD